MVHEALTKILLMHCIFLLLCGPLNSAKTTGYFVEIGTNLHLEPNLQLFVRNYIFSTPKSLTWGHFWILKKVQSTHKPSHPYFTVHLQIFDIL